MRMPTNWLEWLGVVGSILTIISFGLYLFELIKRKKHETMMLGFLHGVKPLVEAMSARPATTGADWEPLLRQLNDMLARLQPPQNKIRVAVTLVCILWVVTAGFYLIAREASGNEMVLFYILSLLFFFVAGVSSLGTFISWSEGNR
jgi:hypothetical protein